MQYAYVSCPAMLSEKSYKVLYCTKQKRAMQEMMAYWPSLHSSFIGVSTKNLPALFLTT